ncbi:MAG: glycosyltransferase, partial [Deltaproteobacteria bacterium]|nr:glycosyltransferase [Deltaproteobacteria bacterium]
MDTRNPQSGATLRILMQMRPNALMQRGGDTVVMERLAAGLRARGIDVCVDVDGKANPRDYDIVHLFNFALPDHTKSLAVRAYEAGTPYVVTTLYEEVSRFYNQSNAVAASLVEYVKGGQNRSWWATNKVDPASVPASGTFDNRWTAEHAAALFTNGAQESKAIRRDYPEASSLIEIKLGHEVGATGDVESFERAYGVKDFVLSVGRFESRKNQLMLLKALEDSDVTVVLCGGGFTYQPEYDRAVRNFKRQGKTIVLDRISPQMLSSAYCAAKVHALPSWYELPGLVSLEAAHHGCNVVVADSGTTPDYFGDLAFYCDPGQEKSIFNAVMAAYFSPLQNGLRERAMSYTWEQTTTQTITAYQSIMASRARKSQPITLTPAMSIPATATAVSATPPPSEFMALVERGENAAMNEKYAEAHQILAQAEAINANSARALKARGTVFLVEGKVAEARTYFTRANAAEPMDPRSISGMAMCELREQRHAEAYTLFVKALDIDPMHLTSLLQLMECSYNLMRFNDLERILRKYLAQRPADVEMQFCLAGCCYKQGNPTEAMQIVENVLREKPGHAGARELQDVLRQRAAAVAAVKPNPVVNSVVQTAVSSEQVFDSNDQQISEIEEAKRERRFDDVKSGITRMSRMTLKPHQSEK